jgi:hypothetical protein
MRSEFSRLEAAVETLKSELEDLKQRLSSLDEEEAAFNESKETIMDLIARLQSRESDDIVRLRSAVAERLRDIVEQILVWPGGTPRSQEVINVLRELFPDKKIDVDMYVPRPDKKFRSLHVTFKDGTFRFVKPTLEDPTKFDLIATRESMIADSDVRARLADLKKNDATPDDYDAALRFLQNPPMMLTSRTGRQTPRYAPILRI